MSTAAAPAEHGPPPAGGTVYAPRRTPRTLLQQGSGGGPALLGSAVALILAAIGLRGGGGLSLVPTTTVEIALELGGGILAIVSILAATGRRAYGGVSLALFGVLAALTAISIVWAVQPSDAWIEASRTFAWMAAFGAGIALARQAGNQWPGLLGGVLAAAVIICAWATLTKVFPAGLAPKEVYARLREPYGYWNAVGLTAALGVPAAMWLGARRTGHAAVSALAYPAMGLLLLTMLLAYSRGSLLAVIVGVLAWLVFVPLRLRGAAVLAVGGAGAAAVILWTFGQDALTKDQANLPARVNAGHELGIAIAAMLLVLLAAGLALGFAGARRPLAPVTRRQLGVALLIVALLVPAVFVGKLALSDKGLTGSISSGWKSLTDPNDRTAVPNAPGRLTKVGSVRAQYWDESLKIFRAHKLTGVGAGGYATARPRYRKDATLAVRHSHGYVVQTAADLGVLGLAASGALLLAWLLAAGRACGIGTHHRRGDGYSRPVTAEETGLRTLAVIVLIFGVHSFVDWTWFTPGTAVMALVCAGWVAGRGPVSERAVAARAVLRRARAGLRSPFRVAAAALVLVLALAVAWSTWQPLRAVGTGNEALAILEDSPTDPAAIDRARELTIRARDQNPLSIDPLFERATVETLAKRPAAARDAFEEAVRLQPGNPATWLALAQYSLDQGRPAKALSLLGPALYLDPHSNQGAAIYLAALRSAREQQAAANARREERAAKARAERAAARRKAAAKRRAAAAKRRAAGATTTTP